MSQPTSSAHTPSATSGRDAESLPDVGRIEAKVQADIDAMVSSHPMGEALAEMALGSARKLDEGVEDKSYAGIQRELRATLVELAKHAAAGADDLEDDLSAPTDPDR